MLRQGDLLPPTAWPRVSMNGYFQSIAYAEVFASGVPFLPGHLIHGKAKVSLDDAQAS